jgi:hypothetical protein
MAPTLFYLTERYKLKTYVKKPIKDIQKGNKSEVNKNHPNTGPNNATQTQVKLVFESMVQLLGIVMRSYKS